MKKYTRSLQKNVDQKTRFMQIVRQHLDRYGIRVARWLPYTEDQTVTYYACMETYRVWIPKPVDTYSFYICMHEIGHIVTGPRKYAHLQEMNAEQYALRKLRQYKLSTKGIEAEAKEYVARSICEDVIWRGFPLHSVQPRITRWIKKSNKQLREQAIQVVTDVIAAPADSTEHFRIF